MPKLSIPTPGPEIVERYAVKMRGVCDHAVGDTHDVDRTFAHLVEDAEDEATDAVELAADVRAIVTAHRQVMRERWDEARGFALSTPAHLYSLEIRPGWRNGPFVPLVAPESGVPRE